MSSTDLSYRPSAKAGLRVFGLSLGAGRVWEEEASNLLPEGKFWMLSEKETCLHVCSLCPGTSFPLSLLRPNS